MIRSFTKIVSLMLLLMIMAASQTTLFAETESNILYESTNLADSNSGTDADDPETLLSSIQVENITHRSVDTLVVVQHTTNILPNRLFTIRAPPYLYL